MYLVKDLDQINSFLLTNFCLYFGTEEVLTIIVIVTIFFRKIKNSKEIEILKIAFNFPPLLASRGPIE
jgi:hypothetical protein